MEDMCHPDFVPFMHMSDMLDGGWQSLLSLIAFFIMELICWHQREVLWSEGHMSFRQPWLCAIHADNWDKRITHRGLCTMGWRAVCSLPLPCFVVELICWHYREVLWRGGRRQPRLCSIHAHERRAGSSACRVAAASLARADRHGEGTARVSARTESGKVWPRHGP